MSPQPAVRSSLLDELVLYHRLGRLSGDYGVRVPMHDLPGAIFGPENTRDAKGHGREILPPTNLGPVALTSTMQASFSEGCI